MHKISPNLAIQKLYIFISVVFLTSFVIEELTRISIDLTVVTMVSLIALHVLLILRKGTIRFLKPDIILMSLILYIFTNEILRGTDITVVISIIFGSFIPYYFGRMIMNENFMFFKKYWLVTGAIAIAWFLLSIDLFDFTTRGGSYNSTVIAMGEIFGITALLLFTEFKDKNKKHFFLLMLGIVSIMLIYLGSRGAVLSLSFAIYIYYKFEFRKIKVADKVKKVIMASVFIVFIIVILNKLEILEKIPILNRFVVGNILTDVSIVGNEHYLGRFDLIKKSIEYFYESPLFGVGFGKVYSHNIVFEILSAYGLVGLILFILWISNVLSLKKIEIAKKNSIIWAAFLCLVFSLVYRMTSFSLLAHKSFFLFAGTFITQLEYIKKDNKLKKIK